MNNAGKKKMAQVKQRVEDVAASAEKNMKKAVKKAEMEVAKVKREMNKSVKKVEAFVKKNPEKAALISAGIGAALGASLAMLMKGKKGKNKK